MLSDVQLFVTPWTVARQAPLSMEFPGKNNGVGCQLHSPGQTIDQNLLKKKKKTKTGLTSME